ncbi:MAG: phosphonoacetaldehyde reductase [Salinivirgaceae bacterium]|nr:phosphonoacetaldehyde reductase [Salinivirgaceae bacterium]
MQQKVFRENQLDNLKSLIKNIDSEKIFLVRANKSYHTSGAELFINQLVNNSALTSFYDFDPNPQLEDLKKGISIFQKGNFDLILCIGGGSVLDMAKLISVFAHQNNNFEDLVIGKAKLENTKTPIVAIPTTAGTGAEATHFAVLYINKKKYSIGHSAILPDIVYISADFSLSANAYLTACTGLDAFCQAVESLWSVNTNAESEIFALEAIEMIWHNLQKAVQENDKASKSIMQEASFLAGKAINITKTTAPHALSYAFTSYYNIPHGHAVALSLPFFLEYNYGLTNIDCTDKSDPQKVKQRIDKLLNILNININDSQNVLVKFFESLGVNINISEIIENFDPNIIIDNVNFERLSNNPRLVSKEDISNFLGH